MHNFLLRNVYGTKSYGVSKTNKQLTAVQVRMHATAVERDLLHLHSEIGKVEGFLIPLGIVFAPF